MSVLNVVKMILKISGEDAVLQSRINILKSKCSIKRYDND